MSDERKVNVLHNPHDMLTIHLPCNAPAPLVMNGAAYVGCPLPRGHAGLHEVRIVWGQ